MPNPKTSFPFGVYSKQPAIRVKPGNKIILNKIVLSSLGNPEYIRFWWAASENALLIGCALANEVNAFKLSNYCYKYRGSIRVRNTVFISAIMKLTKWHNNKVYSILGKYVPEVGMVAFMIEDAVEMEADTHA